MPYFFAWKCDSPYILCEATREELIALATAAESTAERLARGARGHKAKGTSTGAGARSVMMADGSGSEEGDSAGTNTEDEHLTAPQTMVAATASRTICEVCGGGLHVKANCTKPAEDQKPAGSARAQKQPASVGNSGTHGRPRHGGRSNGGGGGSKGSR